MTARSPEPSLLKLVLGFLPIEQESAEAAFGTTDENQTYVVAASLGAFTAAVLSLLERLDAAEREQFCHRLAARSAGDVQPWMVEAALRGTQGDADAVVGADSTVMSAIHMHGLYLIRDEYLSATESRKLQASALVHALEYRRRWDGPLPSDLSQQFRDLVRAMVSGQNFEKVRVSEIGSFTFHRLAYCAFLLAVERRFSETASVEEVREFVVRARTRWIRPESLNPVLAEWSLLDAIVENGSVDDLSLDETLRVQIVLTRALISDLDLTGEALDDFVAEVVEQFDQVDDES
ncbi:hypothetical protein [Kineosporia babensis]|uniref:Uncharacterized protein n=1 Tax=Kineosporia babensis TaxID=499548 RepID=A0A9X1NFK2_9ACTN|nr:hypothetical protein [Kineosporia babensis]MCD5312396.1 hypothetical protein [Kineosporia babensis]